MLLGAAAFTASAVLGAVIARRRGVRISNLVVCGAWILVALPLYVFLLA
jgi:ABC-type dipeptide/oligopeptide/nickel transport system permease component